MASGLKGYEALRARLHAAASATPQLMNLAGLGVVREAKLTVARKTGNLGRSIHVAEATADSVTVEASAAYAGFVERGTRPHEITPRAAKALRFAASASGRRLTGSPRIGADVVFATKVHHPGTKAQPFLEPAAEKVATELDLTPIVKAWNGAA